MHQPVNFVLQADKGPEAGEFGDVARDEVANLVNLINIRPRILGQLFDADGDALVRLVHFEHDGFDFLAFLQHLGGMVDLARPGNVRDVDHAIQALFQLDERSITGEIANLAFDFGAGRIFLLRFVPGVGFELAQAQRDLLLIAIDAQHHSLNLLVRLEDVGGLRDALGPGEFGDVDQPLHTGLQLDEGAVGNQIDDAAFDFGVHRVFLVNGVPGVGELLLEAKAHPLLFAIDVEDDHVNVLADL